MKNPASNPNDNFRSGTNPLVRSQFTRELTDFLKSKINENESWPGLKNDDLISGIIASVKSVSRDIPHGMGLALLLSLSYAAQEEALNSEFDSLENKNTNTPKPIPVEDTSDLRQKEKPEVELDNFQPISFSGQPQSPLFKLGYSAATNGPSDVARRQILASAFRANPEGVFKSHETLARWGDPGTSRRLFAIASFLVWLIDFQGSEKPNAKAKWMSDLNWLQSNLYTAQMKFRWPAPAGLPMKATHRPSAAFMKPMIPSPELAAIIGAEPIPRTEVTKRVWEYIKRHKLQDQANTRNINSDAALMPIFKKSQVTMFEMTKLISDHLS